MKRKFDGGKKKKDQTSDDINQFLRLSEEWEEQYIENAQQMEQELFGSQSAQKYRSAPEEDERAYRDLIRQLRKKGICRGDNPAFISMGSRAAKIHLGRVAGIALVCCACIFAASMTSEANREYFVKNIRYLMGDDTRIVLDNDETNERDSMDEYTAVQDIENRLGIDMPEFYYRPQGLEFLDYEIDTVVAMAKIEYQYRENYIITLLVDRQDQDTASNINSAHGEKTETIVTVSDGLKVSVEKIQDIQDREPSYLAQWENDNVFYYLSGKIEEDELKNIIEQIKY